MEGTVARPIITEYADERQRLYEEGYNDLAIAKLTGASRSGIQGWRKKLKLKANESVHITSNNRGARSAPLERKVAYKLILKGVSAYLIAEELGLPTRTMAGWRQLTLKEHPEIIPHPQRGRGKFHPDGRPYRRLNADRRRRALALYAQDFNDPQIAAELGIKQRRVWEWRNALYLPPNRRLKAQPHAARAKTAPAAPINARSNPLYAAVAQAIGRGLAPDLADDAISDLWLAVEEGTVKVEELKKSAARFRGRVNRRYANKAKFRSLDEEIGSGDGFRMIDLLRDDRSSDWLEEMGATVW
jgi:hypothetical protein